MLLKRLRRAQLFLPAWLAQRNSAIARQLTSKSSGKASSGESQPSDGRPLSLFEELFPEDSRREKSSTTANGRHKFSVRRLAGSSKLEKQITGTDETTLTWSARRAKNYEDQIRASQDTSVLLLSNASKSLILSDFLRLSPKGEHIDGWASGIIKGTSPLLSIPNQKCSNLTPFSYSLSHPRPRPYNSRTTRVLLYPLLQRRRRRFLPR
jgi:hypothetical protein